MRFKRRSRIRAAAVSLESYPSSDLRDPSRVLPGPLDGAAAGAEALREGRRPGPAPRLLEVLGPDLPLAAVPAPAAVPLLGARVVLAATLLEVEACVAELVDDSQKVVL